MPARCTRGVRLRRSHKERCASCVLTRFASSAPPSRHLAAKACGAYVHPCAGRDLFRRAYAARLDTHTACRKDDRAKPTQWRRTSPERITAISEECFPSDNSIVHGARRHRPPLGSVCCHRRIPSTWGLTKKREADPARPTRSHLLGSRSERMDTHIADHLIGTPHRRTPRRANEALP